MVKFRVNKVINQFRSKTPDPDYWDNYWIANLPDINKIGCDRALIPLIIPNWAGTGEETHPDVWDFTIPWNGYRYWMIYTPLPDTFEDPTLVVSNDLQTWIEPPGLTNPLYLKGALGYQSDPDLIYYNNLLWVIWRGRDALNNLALMYGYSYDGINWSTKSFMTVDPSIDQNTEVVSPSILKEDQGFSMYCVDQSTDETGTVEDYCIKRYVSDTISGTWTLDLVVNIDYSITNLPNPTGMGIAAWYVWHLNIVKIGSYYYAVLYTRQISISGDKLWLAVSTDGVNFLMQKYCLINCYNSGYGIWDTGPYRSSIIPLIEDGECKFHLIYTGRYDDAFGGDPMQIGYAKIQESDTYIEIDTGVNSIKSERDDELILANAHSGDYIFADDFDRILETVDGLGTASDGTVYAGESVNYWRVSGDYAYIRANSNAYFRLELSANYLMDITLLSATNVLYIKHIDTNNYISTNGISLQLRTTAGGLVTKRLISQRFHSDNINQFRIYFDAPLCIIYVNGQEEMRYTFVVGDFANQVEMDSFMNEETFRFRMNATGERIYDITVKEL